MSDMEDPVRDGGGRDGAGREDGSRKDPTARLEAALERIAATIAMRKPENLPPDLTMEVAARLDTLIRQIRGALGPGEMGEVGKGEISRVGG